MATKVKTPRKALGLMDGVADYIPDMPGWSSVEKCQRLAQAIQDSKADISVELGIFAGRAILSMAMAHRDINKGVAHGCDPWNPIACTEGNNDPRNDEWWSNLNHYDYMQYFIQIIIKHRLLDFCQWYRIKSQTMVKLFDDKSISVMHQDANHSELTSCQEVKNWDSKIKSGGYWFMDDTNWPSTQKALGMLDDKGYKRLEEHEDWMLFQKP